MPTTHLRRGSDGPELVGSHSGDRVVLTSVWAAEFSARLIAQADIDTGGVGRDLLTLMGWAGLLVGSEAESDEWDFHDSVFHAATRLDTSRGDYGAKTERAEFRPEVAVRRPSIGERIPLDHAESSGQGMKLHDAIARRSSVRDHSGTPIGRADLSAVLDASLRVRRRSRTSTSERAWRAIPTGGALSGLSAVVIAGTVSDLARGAYEYDAVSHELAPATGGAPAINRWLNLAHRLTGIDGASVQAMILFTLDYRRPAHSYDSIVYASALKEVGAALEAMALVSTDRGLSFCPMGGGFATTAGLGDGIRPVAVVGEAVIGRPRASLS